MMKMKIWKKGLAVVLSASMLSGVLPVQKAGEKVYAAEAVGEEVKAISLGTSALKKPAAAQENGETWEGDYVYFGVFEEAPVRYRVLDTGTTEYGSEKTLLLDSDNILKNYHFHDSTASNIWSESDLKKYLNSEENYKDTGFLTESFSDREQAAIAESTKSKPGSGDGTGWEEVFTYAPLEGEKIFILDAAEVTNAGYGYSEEPGNSAARKKQNTVLGEGAWWMRSAVENISKIAGFVSEQGNIEKLSAVTEEDTVGIAPALNIKESEILFVNGNKTAKTAETLQAPETVSDVSGWTLTLKDTGLSVETDGDIYRFVSGEKAVYQFSCRAGADTAEKAQKLNQLSLMITDKEYDAADAQILYYGKAADIAVEEGEKESGSTVEIALPQENSSWHYYLLAEEVNGEGQTDYASLPVEIDFSTAKTAITHVSVTDITPAEGGRPLDTQVVCDTAGVAPEAITVTWTPADNEKAEYNTAYCARITLKAQQGYVFYGEVTAEVDGEPAASAVKSENGSELVLTTQEYRTAKAKLLEIEKIPGVSVENGTPLSEILEKLPETCAVVTEDEKIKTADISWNTENLCAQYDPSAMTEQKFTVRGTIVCPAELDTNQKDLTVDLLVEIGAAVKAPTTVTIINPEESFLEADEEELIQKVPGGAAMKEVRLLAEEGHCIPMDYTVTVNGVPVKLDKNVEEDTEDAEDTEDEEDVSGEEGDEEESDGYQLTLYGVTVETQEGQQELVVSGTPTVDITITLSAIGTHNGGAGVITELPTCGAEGEYTYRCDICGQTWTETIEPTGAHALVFIPEVAATYETEGNIAYYECGECGMLFADAAGTQEISRESTVLPVLQRPQQPSEPEPVVPADGIEVITASEPVILPNIAKEPEMIIGNAFSSSWVLSNKIDATVLPKMMEPAEAKSTAVVLYWNEVAGADGYLVYGAECGTNENVVKKIKEIKNSYTTTYTHKKLTPNTWYKYKVVAYKVENGKRTAIGKTLELYVVTAQKSSKYANPAGIKTSVGKVVLKKGKSRKVSAQLLLPADKKLKKYTAEIRWVSTNQKIAKVDKKGKITAKKKGTCYVYAFTQNGCHKKIKVTVK